MAVRLVTDQSYYPYSHGIITYAHYHVLLIFVSFSSLCDIAIGREGSIESSAWLQASTARR